MQNPNYNNILKNLKDFLSSLVYCTRLSWKTSKLYTGFRAFAVIANALISFVSIYIAKDIIDILANADIRNYFRILFLLCISTLLQIISSILLKVEIYIQDIHDELINNYFRISVLDRLFTADMEFFDTPDYLDSVNAVSRDSVVISQIVWHVFSGLGALASLLSSWILISRENIFYPLIVLVSVLPSVIINRHYIKKIYQWRLDNDKTERKIGYLLSLGADKYNVCDLRIFNARNYLMSKFYVVWNKYIGAKKKLFKKRLAGELLVQFLPELCILGILMQIVFYIMSGTFSIGDYALFGGLLGTLSMNFTQFIECLVFLLEDNLKADTLNKFDHYKNKVLDNGELELSGPIEIEFRKVSFQYAHNTHFTLKDLSFKIQKFEKICLIGINGAGKSTVIKLLMRFYDVTEGSILINGIDIKKYKLNSLRACVSTFFQVSGSYSFTLRENINISDLEKVSETGDEEIFLALKQADAAGLLKKAPKGLDTYITKMFDESGMETSGGEEQKLALARTIYRARPLLIFDEPSASLDPVSEYNLFYHLQTYWKDKTVIFTSHRLSAVHLADRIFLLEDGHIAESGTHEELMRANGRYHYLYELQSSKYV